MGDCTFCGKPAGLFKSRHKECLQLDEARKAKERAEAEAYEAAQREIASARRALVSELKDEASRAILDGSALKGFEARILEAMANEKIDFTERKEILISAWECAVEGFLDDSVLSDVEEERLVRFQDHFALKQDELNRSGYFLRVAKSAVLRRVLDNVVPSNVEFEGNGRINFVRGESAVWAFGGATYLEDTVRRQTVGGSQGMSFRIMSGVYYRVGGFKGESISTVVRKDLGTGALVVTNMSLYFIGELKITRVPYQKVISFTPYSDGFGLLRDAATAKPQLFKVDDAWFAFNLITNLARIHNQA